MSFTASYLYQLRDKMTPTLEKIKKANDKLSKSVMKNAKRMSKNLESAGKKMKDAGRDMMMAGATITAPLALATNQALKFGKGVAELSTLMPTKTLGAVRKEFSGTLKGISNEFGTATDDVVSSAYQAVSAGIAPQQKAVDEFLRIANKASIGGVATLETAVDGLTSVMNAYKGSGLGVTQISDEMFTAVRLGKTTFRELSASLFNVIPTASALKVKFGDVTSAIAVLTASGTPTRVATTEMRQMFTELGKSSTAISKVFKKISGKSFPDFIEAGGNTAEALSMIDKEAVRTGKKMMDMFGSVEAGAGAMVLAKNGAEAYKVALEKTKNAVGATSEAFKKMKADASFKFGVAKQRLMTLVITIGDRLMPMMVKFMEIVVRVGNKISNWMNSHEKLSRIILSSALVFGILLTTLGAFALVAGTIIAGIGKMIMVFVVLKGAIVAIGGALTLLFANPIGLAILAVVALGVAIYSLVMYWDEVKTFAVDTFTSIYNAVASFYNKYRAIITVLSIPLLPLILTIKGVIALWKGVGQIIMWMVDGSSAKIEHWVGFIKYAGERIAKAIDFKDKLGFIEYIFDRIASRFGWLESKVRSFLSMLGIDLPPIELITKVKPPTDMRDFSADYFDTNQNGQSRPSTESTASTSKSVDVNVSNDVGGVLEIKVSGAGKAQVTNNKPKGKLGYQVQ